MALAKQRLEARKKRRQMIQQFRGDKKQIHATLVAQLGEQEKRNALDATKGRIFRLCFTTVLLLCIFMTYKPYLK